MRSLLAIAVVALAALAAWLAFPDASGASTPAAEAPDVVPAQFEAERADGTSETADAPARRADAVVDPSPISPPTTTRARLDVRVVAAGTREPLARVRVGLALDVPDARSVDVERSRGTVGENLWSDADGGATFDVEPGVALRLWSARGDVPARPAEIEIAPLAPGEARSVELARDVEPDLVFHGRVLARETREPIAGAPIAGERPPRGDSDLGVTGADGVFRVALRTWETVGLRVSAHGFGHRWVGPRAGHETPETALEIPLDRGSTLRVRALAADRTPLVDATARVEAWIAELGSGASGGNRYLDAMSWTAATGADGVATLVDLPPDAQLRGTLTRGGRIVHTVAEPFALRPGEVREVTWTLDAPGEVRGVVRETDGAPVARQTIWLQRATTAAPTIFRSYDESRARRTTATDERGSFRFADVAPGSWWVGPGRTEPGREDPERDPVAHGELVVVADGPADVALTLVRGLVIRGRIVGADGVTPAIGHAGAKRAAEKLYVDAGPAGDAFVVGPLLPGRWTLSAFSPDGASQSADVEAEAGASGVVLQLVAQARLRLRVLDASGDPVPHAGVLAGNVEHGTTSSETDENGRREFLALPPGRLFASARMPDGRWALATGLLAASGQALDVDLVLQAGVRARLVCRAAEKGTRFVVERDGSPITFVDAQTGASVEFTLPLGRSTLRALPPGAAPLARELDVAAGAAVELTFDGGWR